MITPKTIARFLIGDRDAIEAVASSKGALFLAALFIISAGLARNYDHHLLVHEPLWILGPFGMTLFSSFFIFTSVKSAGRIPCGILENVPTRFLNYLPFLRCFAMTAPLAWLYGIPVEQFTTALTATQFNFSVLLLVSFWRLGLMVRVLTVLFNCTPLRAFCLISIPASIEMFFATWFKSLSIVGIMGGMKLTTAEDFLYKATQTVTGGSFVLFIAATFLIFFSKRGEIRALSPVKNPPQVSKPTWTAAIIVIALWLFASVEPQRRLHNLRKFQSLIAKEQYTDAQIFTESLTKENFPPHRRLLNKRFNSSPPFEVQVLVHHNTWPDWVRKELDETARIWLKDLPPFLEDHRIEMLREKYHKAPHIKEFAEKFTPDHDLESIPIDETETLPPTIGNDHFE